MIFIVKMIQKFTQKEIPTPLGRWGLDYCNKKVNQKIELSNEDHCGSCGQYASIQNEGNTPRGYAEKGITSPPPPIRNEKRS